MPFNVPKYIEVKDKSGNPTAFLRPQDGVKDAVVDMKQNNASTLELYLPPSSPKLQELTPECLIYPGNDREYILLKDEALDLVRDSSGKLWARVMAVESFFSLNYEFCTVRNDSPAPPSHLHTVTIVSGGSDLSMGLYTVGSAAHALYGLLTNVDWAGKTPWTVGTVDVTGIHDLETDKKNVLENINKIQELWGGILDWDSANHIVSLRDPETWQPYNGFNITYRKNLKEITRTQSSRIITRLYVYGMDSLNIAAVNDGKEYLEDYSYTSSRYNGIVQNPDISDQNQLKEWGLRQLDTLSKPRSSYSIKAVDLRSLPEFSHETFALNDMVDIIDPDITGQTRARITRHSYKVFQPWSCEIEIGDPVLSLEDILADSSLASNFISNTINSSGRISGTPTNNSLQLAIDAATTAINTALGGYVVKRENELLIMDTTDIETATKVWRWNQNGLGYSNDGYDGPYATAITADGQIVADFITAGTLLGIAIKTAQSGKRLELSGNMLSAFNAAGVRTLSVDGDELVIYDKSGVRSGVIDANDTYVTINGPKGVFLQASDESVGAFIKTPTRYGTEYVLSMRGNPIVSCSRIETDALEYLEPNERKIRLGPIENDWFLELDDDVAFVHQSNNTRFNISEDEISIVINNELIAYFDSTGFHQNV